MKLNVRKFCATANGMSRVRTFCLFVPLYYFPYSCYTELFSNVDCFRSYSSRLTVLSSWMSFILFHLYWLDVITSVQRPIGMLVVIVLVISPFCRLCHSFIWMDVFYSHSEIMGAARIVSITVISINITQSVFRFGAVINSTTNIIIIIAYDKYFVFIRNRESVAKALRAPTINICILLCS